MTGVVTLPEGTEMVMPGDNTEMTVALIQPVAMEDGLKFAIREGGRTGRRRTGYQDCSFWYLACGLVPTLAAFSVACLTSRRRRSCGLASVGPVHT